MEDLDIFIDIIQNRRLKPLNLKDIGTDPIILKSNKISGIKNSNTHISDHNNLAIVTISPFTYYTYCHPSDSIPKCDEQLFVEIVDQTRISVVR